jgi:hypothetical protein
LIVLKNNKFSKPFALLIVCGGALNGRSSNKLINFKA